MPNKNFSKQALKLIANFRDISEGNTDFSAGLPIAPFSDVLQKTLKGKFSNSPKNKTIELLQTYWKDWFLGTDFVKCTPERLDKWDCLWIRVPNAILRQKLQFKTALFLNAINNFLPKKIKDVHWFV